MRPTTLRDLIIQWRDLAASIDRDRAGSHLARPITLRRCADQAERALDAMLTVTVSQQIGEEYPHVAVAGPDSYKVEGRVVPEALKDHLPSYFDGLDAWPNPLMPARYQVVRGGRIVLWAAPRWRRALYHLGLKRHRAWLGDDRRADGLERAS